MPAAAAAAKRVPPRRRRDPKPRLIDGMRGWGDLDNKRPDKKYILANEEDQHMGRRFYESIGYMVELAEKGGVRFANGVTVKEGEPLVTRGHVLMSIDLEEAESIDYYGLDGKTGQKRLDEIDAMLLKKGIHDPLRGQSTASRANRYHSVKNEGSGLEEEIEE